MKQTMKYLTLLALALFMCSCSTMDSIYTGTASMTDPDSVVLRPTLNWANPAPNLNPVPPERMKVYVRIRNTSGSDINFKRSVNAAVLGAGYQVTRDINEAQFIINADLRKLEEVRVKSGGRGTLISAGVGAAAGAAVGHNVGNGEHRTEGAIIGAVLGALFGDTMANRNKMVTYQMIVDLRVGERIEGGVTTTRSSNDAKTNIGSSSVRVGPTNVGGSSRQTATDKQAVKMRGDFYYQTNTLVAQATKLKLLLTEAAPVLSDKIGSAIGNVLP